ncbi:24103_t:CDS:10 [Gigaspora margarita]|uniref:24103_t:CDS:1 n=1 Tax=Gigaspora margarita TaxID=4874 RepID=A0ABN7VX73_GIGMA|nr:24103_t:CDS:10 [Gigaspora margarita]
MYGTKNVNPFSDNNETNSGNDQIAVEIIERFSKVLNEIFIPIYDLTILMQKNEPPIVYYRFPTIGHTWSFFMNCEKLITESQKKYGETFTLYVFGELVTITGKDMLYEVLNKNEFSFHEGSESQLLIYNVLPYAAKNINKPIKILRTFFKINLSNVMHILHQNTSNAINTYIGECADPKVINEPNELLLKIIVKVAANVIFGEECGQYEDVLDIFENFTYLTIKILFVPKILCFIHPWLHEQAVSFPLRYISKHRTVISSRIKPIIKKRFEEKKKLGDAWIAPSDALQLGLDDPEIAPDLNPNKVDYNLIIDTIVLFIFAAMSSTSRFSSYILYELAKRKEYWEKLYQEAQEINKQCNGKLKSEDLAKMVKLDSFIKETSRLSNNLLSMPRKCIYKSHYTLVDGYQIPSDRTVYLNVIDVCHDEKLQGQNPKEFNAYRHNSSATKLDRSFLIFGRGKHACPGRYFAVNMMKLLFNEIILKYNIKPANEKIEPRNYIGCLIGPLKGGVVFENRN